MVIYPAIWLRPSRGRTPPPQITEQIQDGETYPVETALQCERLGAEWLFCINAARGEPAPIRVSGDYVGADLSAALASLRAVRAATAVPIMFGGSGLRCIDDMARAFGAGAERVVIGAAARESPMLVADAVDRWGPDRVAVAIRGHKGKVVVGQERNELSRVSVIEMGHRLHALGLRYAVYNDAEQLSLQARPGIGMVTRLGDETGLNIICGGAVTSLHEVEALKNHEHFNIEGVVLDASLHGSKVDLRSAIKIGKRPLSRHSAGLVPYRRRGSSIEFLLIYNLFFEQWQFPRGGIKPGEMDLECAVRELREETGLEAVQVHEECRIELEYTATIRNHLIERKIVYFPAEVREGEVSLSDENHCESLWVDGSEACRLLSETSPEQIPALETTLKFLGGRSTSP